MGEKKSAKAKPQKQNNYIIDSGVKMMIPFSNIFCILVPMVEIDVWCFGHDPSILCKTQNHSQKHTKPST